MYEVKGREFCNEDGDTLYFHGMNIVDKGTPIEGSPEGKKGKPSDMVERKYDINLTDAELIALKAMGVNAIRLGFTWDAIEPIQGLYNEDYIAKLVIIVDKCGEHDVAVLLDMHQDVYSAFGNGAGDGAPDWATVTDDKKYKIPLIVWAEGYFLSKAVSNAFDNFWNNTEVNGIGLQDSYARCWAHLATTFRGKKALFGYDLMNEPFMGNKGRKIFRKIVAKSLRVVAIDRKFPRLKALHGLLCKKHRAKISMAFSAEIFRKITMPCDKMIVEFDKMYYMPFVNRVSHAIREVTKTGIICTEHNYYGNLGTANGLERIKIGENDEPRQCYSPHGYDVPIDTGAYNYASIDRVKVIFDQSKKTAERNNVPVIVGEWGGSCHIGTLWQDHLKEVMEYFDEIHFSHLYWYYSQKLFRCKYTNIFFRPYVQRIRGAVTEQKYMYGKYRVKVTIDEKGKDNLQIYLPLDCDIAKNEDVESITQLITREQVEGVIETFADIMDDVPIEIDSYLNAKIVSYSLPKGEHELVFQSNMPSSKIA